MDTYNDELLDACQRGDLSKVKHYFATPHLAKHIDIHYREDVFFRAACRNNHLDIAEYLTASPDLTEHIDIESNKDKCFIRACEDGHLDVVKYFLKHGADIHHENDNAFVHACISNSYDVVEYLLTSHELKEHANIHAQEDMGFKMACVLGYTDIALFLMQQDDYMAERLELCLHYLGDERVMDAISNLSSEQEAHLFDRRMGDLFPLYIEHNKELPDCVSSTEHKEIDLIM